ncbi:hypothetical protein [Pseudomonas sp. DP-17]|uniref:hypothetical protein n=1 Tax=Pseudomonas sp. DP-17 TaxID=1580486 RepID=UPI001EFAE54C|nr:hypothetical protein [Pseudomonas sp. DP-17]MCG8906423.1 hypothetical protein [Pseudomonas sp. DP-17]
MRRLILLLAFAVLLVLLYRAIGLHEEFSIDALRRELTDHRLGGLNYRLALPGIGLRPYMLGTLLGLPIPLLLCCLLFERLGNVLLG